MMKLGTTISIFAQHPAMRGLVASVGLVVFASSATAACEEFVPRIEICDVPAAWGEKSVDVFEGNPDWFWENQIALGIEKGLGHGGNLPSFLEQRKLEDRLSEYEDIDPSISASEYALPAEFSVGDITFTHEGKVREGLAIWQVQYFAGDQFLGATYEIEFEEDLLYFEQYTDYWESTDPNSIYKPIKLGGYLKVDGALLNEIFAR